MDAVIVRLTPEAIKSACMFQLVLFSDGALNRDSVHRALRALADREGMSTTLGMLWTPNYAEWSEGSTGGRLERPGSYHLTVDSEGRTYSSSGDRDVTIVHGLIINDRPKYKTMPPPNDDSAVDTRLTDREIALDLAAVLRTRGVARD